MNILKRIPACCVLISFSLLTGCSLLPSAKPPVITKPYSSVAFSTAEATNETIIRGPDVDVKAIALVANPPAGPETVTDPSSEIDEALIAFFQPGKATLDLYNDLYRAVLKESESFDLASCNLPVQDKITACELLLYEGSFHLPYLQNYNFSDDHGTVYFLYETEDTKKIQIDRETLSARLGHILYNVPPEGGTDLARFAAVFQYLCETTDSAPMMAGTRLAGPDSLLLQNSGICWGYARLLNYVLPRIGITCNTISNQMHTWNQVVINDKLYHTDLSFAAGAFHSHSNSFETFLMDDIERERTLADSGMTDLTDYLGFDGRYSGSPSSCEDSSFQVYGSIHDVYALDAEHEKIYVNDYMGIKGMNLDGSSLLTLSQKYVSSMAFFDGTIYFIDDADGSLYSLVPGKKPLLLDGDEDNEIVFLDGAGIFYGTAASPDKYLRLLPSASDIEETSVYKLPSADANRSLSYYFTVTFSTPMDMEAAWNRYVILTNDVGDALQTRQTWNEDGTVMTVRPLQSIDEYKSLSCYILAGAPSQENGIIRQSVCLPVKIHSIADQLPAG